MNVVRRVYTPGCGTTFVTVACKYRSVCAGDATDPSRPDIVQKRNRLCLWWPAHAAFCRDYRSRIVFVPIGCLTPSTIICVRR